MGRRRYTVAMLASRRHLFGTLAFSSALLGVILPVACGGDDSNPVQVSGTASSVSTSTSTAMGSGGSTLQFMAGPMTGTGGDLASSTMASTGTGEGGTGKVTYGWDVTYGGNSASDQVVVYDLGVDKLGNIILAGAFKGSIDFDGPGANPATVSKGDYDAFIAKYDNKGTFKWVKAAGDGSPQTANTVAIDSNNRIGFCGSFRGGMNFGGNTLQVQDQQYTDAYAAILDADGTHVASQRYGVGFGNNDSCSAVAFDAAGNLLATGQYQGQINFGVTSLMSPSPGGYPMYLAKLAPNAGTKGFTELLAKSYGAADYISQGLAVAVAADGDIALAGWTEGTINFGGATLTPVAPESGIRHAVVARLDATGTPKFNKLFDGDDSLATSIAFHSNGDLVVGGNFKFTIDVGGGPMKATGPSDDVFVARFDKTNKFLHSVKFGDKSSDQLNDIAVDPAGFPVFAGSFQGTVKVNSTNELIGKGIRDGMVVKLANDDGHGYWGYGFGDAALQEARGIAVDGQGNVVFAGSFQGTVDLGGGVRVAPNGSQGLLIGSFLP